MLVNEKFLGSLLWCKNCPLHKTRTNVVVGDGNPKANILFIGEAPGTTEDTKGIPFCGISGKLLRELIEIAGIRKEEIYITNVVKCRPPGNRDPSEDEISKCLPYLKTQIKLIKPRFVVGVGRISAGRIIPAFQMTRDHGKLTELGNNGKMGMGIYHPAYILRNRNLKETVITDLKTLKKAVDSK